MLQTFNVDPAMNGAWVGPKSTEIANDGDPRLDVSHRVHYLCRPQTYRPSSTQLVKFILSTTSASYARLSATLPVWCDWDHRPLIADPTERRTARDLAAIAIRVPVAGGLAALS